MLNDRQRPLDFSEALPDQPELRFDGADISAKEDTARLTKQIGRIYNLMIDGKWRTLEEIEKATGDPQASISAQLRNLRKKRFGGYQVFRQPKGDRKKGLYEYRMEGIPF